MTFTDMKNQAAISTAASTPAVLVSSFQWFGAHVSEVTLYLTCIWTAANVVMLGYKFVKWCTK
jgi:hypothetical protein